MNPRSSPGEPCVTGKNRRTLSKIDYYPTPQELYNRCTTHHWTYKGENKLTLQTRDNALVSILYLAGLRISEATRLTAEQFITEKQKLTLIRMQLSKSQRLNHATGEVIARKNLYRTSIPLPNKGARVGFTDYIKLYLNTPPFLDQKTRLFPITTNRIDQIVKKKMGVPPHWLRAYCENYLYELWDCDIIAVANYMSVDPATLSKYIRRVPTKYLKRE